MSLVIFYTAKNHVLSFNIRDGECLELDFVFNINDTTERLTFTEVNFHQT